MTMTTNDTTPRRKGRLGSALTSLATIMGAFATIMTAVATILGLLVQHQATQLQHASAKASTEQRQIAQQKQTIQQLRSAASPSPSASGSGATGADATLSGVAHYLSSETPTVDNVGVDAGQQVIAAKVYPNTITWGCGNSSTPNEAYDVAGSSVFTAEVGIADNAQGATGVTSTVTFTNESGKQIGQPVQLSLGHPVSLRLNIRGVTQLGMSCTGRDQQTSQPAYDFSVSLGNAGVS